MSSTRYFENTLTGVQRRVVGADQILFVSTFNSAAASSISTNLATFSNRSFLTPPEGFTIDEDSFAVYVNGLSINPLHVTVQQSGSNITVSFNPTLIGYDIEPSDSVVLTGKFK